MKCTKCCLGFNSEHTHTCVVMCAKCALCAVCVDFTLLDEQRVMDSEDEFEILM